MPDAIVIASIASAMLALPALAKALWHVWQIERHRHP